MARSLVHPQRGNATPAPTPGSALYAAPRMAHIGRMNWLRVLLLVIAFARPAFALDFHPRFEPTSSLVVVLDKRHQEADAEVRLAQAQLAAESHLGALRNAEHAKVTYTDVRAEADKVVAYVDALEATRLAYEQRVASLEQVRAEKLAEIRRYGGAGRSSSRSGSW